MIEKLKFEGTTPVAPSEVIKHFAPLNDDKAINLVGLIPEIVNWINSINSRLTGLEKVVELQHEVIMKLTNTTLPLGDRFIITIVERDKAIYVTVGADSTEPITIKNIMYKVSNSILQTKTVNTIVDNGYKQIDAVNIQYQVTGTFTLQVIITTDTEVITKTKQFIIR